MTLEPITRKRAIHITGIKNLPYGYNWYLVTGIEFYPTYGDWSHLTAGSDGLLGIIGKQKQAAARKAAA
jgi:hypothetical protein